MNAPENHQQKRIASLDLLRGLAAFGVAIPHYLILADIQRTSAEVISVLSVEVFFVLSGFVLAPQIIRCAESLSFADLRIFLIRRWMRTILPYLVPLIALSVLYGELFSADFWRYLFYLQNLFAQHNTRDYFPIAWSLSIEEWFYLIFPALLMIASLVFGIRGPRFWITFSLCYIAAVTTLRVIFGQLDDWGSDVRRVVIFREDSIAYGFLAYFAVKRTIPPTLGAKTVALQLALFITAAAIAWYVTFTIGLRQSPLAELVFPWAAAAFGVSAIFLCCAIAPALDKPPLRNISLFLGRISYSVYLLHLLVALALRPRLAEMPLGAQLGIYVATLALLTAAFYRFYEKPILAARPEYRRASELAIQKA